MSDERGLAIPGQLGPGMVPTGFSETILERAIGLDDPEILWDGATTFAALAQKWNGHGKEKTEIKSAQMFCEILLGQILGPNPGDAGKGPGKSAHAHFLPKEMVRDFRRLHGWRDALVEAVRNGKRSRRSLLLEVDRWEAAERAAEHGEPTVDDLDIRRGDFRDILVDVDPGSVALILTDPPYPTEYLPLWDDLGAWAAGALIDGGSLIAYCGQSILPEVLRRLDRSLRYWWTIALLHGQSQMIPGKWISAGWKPLVWFVRGGRANTAMLADTVHGGAPRKTLPTGDDGSWAQSVEAVEPIISALTAPGDLIVDPFAGSGTFGLAARRFGRRFIGAELGGL